MGVFAGMSDVKVQEGNKLPEGNWTGFVQAAKIITKKDKTESLLLTYRVEEPEGSENYEYNGWTIDEWRSLPIYRSEEDGGGFVDEAAQRNAQFLKSRLLSLGVKEEEMDDMEPKELVGIPVAFAVKVNGPYTNVRYVSVRETSDGGVDSSLF